MIGDEYGLIKTKVPGKSLNFWFLGLSFATFETRKLSAAAQIESEQ